MNKVKRGKKVRAVSVGVGILAFLLAFGAGAVSKFAIQPGWAKEYSVKWSDELGTLKEDLPYGDGDANKFDLYLPKDSGKSHYGLAVYLHAGGFTSGDKSGDREMDILPLIREIHAAREADGTLILHATLAAGGSANLSPEFLVAALREKLGMLTDTEHPDVCWYRILRTGFLCADGSEFR